MPDKTDASSMTEATAANGQLKITMACCQITVGR